MPIGEKYLATGRPCSTTIRRFHPGGTAVSITRGEDGEEGRESPPSLEECGGVGGADSLLSGSKRSAGRVP